VAGNLPFSQGHQVAPTELEAHILLLDEVAECAVFAVDDAIAGERPKAAVVRSELRGELSVKHVETHMSRHKWLKGGVEIVQALPKTSSGKVLRRLLRDRERQRSRGQGAGRL
jgi:acyl-coenzyme A synthetase/AMP-(fatty) acid ligase